MTCKLLKAHLLQIGKAPLHVAAETGNLESLIRLLDAGAHRAPRDRVSPSTPLLTHATNCTSAFSLLPGNACRHMSLGCYLCNTWWALAEDISFIACQKACICYTACCSKQPLAAPPNSKQGMSAVLAPVAITCCAATQLRHCIDVGKALS